MNRHATQKPQAPVAGRTMPTGAAAEATPAAALETMRHILAKRCGLRYHADNEDVLAAGLRHAAIAEQLTVQALVERIASANDAALLQRLIQHVTIGETYFFRHPEHFTLLTHRIIPDLLQRGDKGPLRLWSAACSTGEEAYSLAMAAHPFVRDLDQLQVLGTDIHRGALDTARAGIYGEHARRGTMVPPARAVRPLDRERFIVDDKLRAAVHFAYLNLHDTSYVDTVAQTQGQHLIFCRNALMYFFPEVTTQIMARLRDCLVEGGYLIVSPWDTALAPPGLRPIDMKGALVLQRHASHTVRSVKASAKPSPARTPEARSGGEHVAQGHPPHVAPKALAQKSTAEAMYITGLVHSERGETATARRVLEDLLRAYPGYVLGHLALGLLAVKIGDSVLGTRHLHEVLTLLSARKDHEILPGPDSLSVAWVRTLAQGALGGKVQ